MQIVTVRTEIKPGYAFLSLVTLQIAGESQCIVGRKNQCVFLLYSEKFFTLRVSIALKSYLNLHFPALKQNSRLKEAKRLRFDNKHSLHYSIPWYCNLGLAV